MSTFHVGDQVLVQYGLDRFPGRIIEDRGAIGVGGRHLYQVLVPMDPDEPATWEIREDELEPLSNAKPQKPLRKQEVIEYLKNAGLIAILRSNISGGPRQPRVWLRYDNSGNVTHTFYAERGVAGGATVPFFAVNGEKIFTPKRDEVLAYLQTFGLSKSEAEDVLREVGTAP